MTSTALADDAALPTSAAARWVQLLLGLACMMAISSPQYVWALFTKPLAAQLGATAPAIQTTFSLLVIVQTFFSPAQGWLVERLGPRGLIAFGAALTGLSWITAATASSLAGLWLTYGLLGGLGTGIVYVGVVGLMMDWFPDRRGFAAGVVAAGYGMGAVLTTFPIADSLANAGLAATLQRWGFILGAIGVAAALFLRRPPAAPALSAGAGAGFGHGVATGAMLRAPLFWLMFAMMAMMSTSGLMVTSQIGLFAADLGITKVQVLGMAALPFALTLDRFCNGLTRPFFGWVSDRIGRENTMALAFALEAAAMAAWFALRGDPLLFALLSGVVFFGWGEIFSLFPSTLTDTFGPRWATRNYGCLYMAQGIGAVFGGPLASLLHGAAGGWTLVFAVAIGADLLTAALALLALKPMRRAYAGRLDGVSLPRAAVSAPR